MDNFPPVTIRGLGAITAHGDFQLAQRHQLLELASGKPRAIPDFAVEKYAVSPKNFLDRCSALALAGCAMALEDAGMQPADQEAALFGITLGTHLGCVDTMQVFWDRAMEKGVKSANALLFSHTYFNTPISLCAIEWGLRGYHQTFCAGQASGWQAVRAAYDAIRLGHASLMLAGGVEALSTARTAGEGGDAGEAAVFFVLGAGTEAGGVQVDEDWFERAGLIEGDLNALYGDCGGAQGALALAAALP